MRVIAGEFRSRIIKTLPGLETRPTPDRLREALFNILQPRLAGESFLDAYAGTGAVGIEALSRGAGRVIFIERSKAAVNLIRENVAALQLQKRAEILHGRTFQYLPRREADIVFLDPPFQLHEEYNGALEILGEKGAPLVIAQHSSRFDLAPAYGAIERTRILKQGDNTLSFYRRVAASNTST